MRIIGEAGIADAYISVMHTKDSRLRYNNYVYTFESSPPFRIQRVGRAPLRVRGERIRFVSSLTVLGRTSHSKKHSELLIGISYGADDKEVRHTGPA